MLIMPLLSVTRTLRVWVCALRIQKKWHRRRRRRRKEKKNSHGDEHTVRPLLLLLSSLHYWVRNVRRVSVYKQSPNPMAFDAMTFLLCMWMILKTIVMSILLTSALPARRSARPTTGRRVVEDEKSCVRVLARTSSEFTLFPSTI